MSDTAKLVTALKQELRRQGKTYADLTAVLSLSHASVKRLFAEGSFTLQRLETICTYLGTDFTSLVTAMDKEAERIDQLSFEQEQELVKNPRLLCFAHALFNKWSFEEIINTYDFSEHEAIRLMAHLDRMGLIDMQPGNRYRLLISRSFDWIKAGPIQIFFEKELQADFFNARFNKDDELRLYVSSMLSRRSALEIIRKLNKLAGEVNELHLEDEKLTIGERRGYSLVLAFRPWETRVFSAMRRQQVR